MKTILIIIISLFLQVAGATDWTNKVYGLSEIPSKCKPSYTANKKFQNILTAKREGLMQVFTSKELDDVLKAKRITLNFCVMLETLWEKKQTGNLKRDLKSYYNEMTKANLIYMNARETLKSFASKSSVAYIYLKGKEHGSEEAKTGSINKTTTYRFIH